MQDTISSRLNEALRERKEQKLLRATPLFDARAGELNLADNDYCGMAAHPETRKAAQEAIERYGCSSSASPLICGYGAEHDALLRNLRKWHGFPCGMLWNTGYAANQAILSMLPRKGDLVLADRLIHNSMISGILRSGARIMRYPHCDLKRLEKLLEEHATGQRAVFVVTESVFSMDGDYPDLKQLAALKERFNFFWIVDEAHALGWYGSRGSGLIEQSNVAAYVDVLVGTLGKGLGSSGAYSLFNNETLVGYFENFAGEYIYSTFLPPASAAAARRAIELIESCDAQRAAIRQRSRWFRDEAKAMGFETLPGDSPIVPIVLGDAERVLSAGERLMERGIRVGTVRPPTVPAGAGRLRISLKTSMTDEDFDRLLKGLASIR